MARFGRRRSDALDAGFVLAPERYDPRRARKDGVPLGELVRVSRAPLDRDDDARVMVLDTSHAREGTLAPGPTLRAREVGSAKKALRAGQVIISRLRPYLRQVALVDLEGPLACSTEFFVLEGTDARSIAFLVPFLLSAPAQEVLAASQEGGHHPRVSEEALLGLAVPRAWVDDRDRLSAAVRDAVRRHREAAAALAELVARAEVAST